MSMAGTALPRQGRNLPCMATRQMAARKEAGTCSYAGGYLLQRSYHTTYGASSLAHVQTYSVHVLCCQSVQVLMHVQHIHRYREINVQYE